MDMGSDKWRAGALDGVNEVGENGARRLKFGPGGRGTGALDGVGEVGENGARRLREGQYGVWARVGVGGWVWEVMGIEDGMGKLE